jgi:hypothetical protein
MSSSFSKCQNVLSNDVHRHVGLHGKVRFICNGNFLEFDGFDFGPRPLLGSIGWKCTRQGWLFDSKVKRDPTFIRICTIPYTQLNTVPHRPWQTGIAVLMEGPGN